jgi:hypothetical protein
MWRPEGQLKVTPFSAPIKSAARRLLIVGQECGFAGAAHASRAQRARALHRREFGLMSGNQPELL